MIRIQDEEFKTCGDGLCLFHAVRKEHDHIKIESVLKTKESSYQIIGFTPDFHIDGVNIISFDESSEITAVSIYLIRKCRSVFIFPPRIKRVVKREIITFFDCDSCCPKIEAGESDQRFVSINGDRVVLNHFPLEVACQLSARHRFCLRETTRFVGDGSFYMNKNIRTVVIPSSVEYIGYSAFTRCSQLRFIVFKKNSRLKRIGRYSFAYTDVESFEIPSSVEEIGEYSFYGCKNLRSVTFPDDSKLKRIGNHCFCYTLITTLIIPSNVDNIDKDAFCGCLIPKSVIFPEDTKLKKIDGGMFSYSTIESIKIPSPIKEIGDESFYKCRNLRSVTFSDNSNLKKIGNKSFSLSAIESICIPSSVEEIGDEAFRECLCLSSVSYQDKTNIKRMGRDVFTGCPCLIDYQEESKYEE